MGPFLARRGGEHSGENAPPEEPVLAFRRYAIAFHVAAEWPDDAKEPKPEPRGQTEDERGLESYEADMLSHSHRDAPPFRSRMVSSAGRRMVSSAGRRTMTVRFPPVLTYEAEGDRKTLVCNGATDEGRSRTFELIACRTTFERSEIAVLSLVLLPLKDSADAGSELNEYDVIKLIKLWEGGELLTFDSGRVDPFVPGRNDRATQIEFVLGATGGRTLNDVALDAFPGWRLLPVEPGLRAYRVGTVELELPEARWNKALFRDLEALKDDTSGPKADSARWHRAVAVGGILQGLLDFREIEEDELSDVFADADIDSDDQSLFAVHKGTVLSLVVEADSVDDRRSPIGVDPYLAVPNAVLLHNEERLKSARLLEQEVSSGQREGLFEGGRLTINETENRLGRMSRHLSHHLPNVFHYPSERQLYERGSRLRGFEDLETLLRRRMDELISVLQERTRRRDRWTTALGIVIGVAATAQAFIVQEAIKGVDVWVVLLVALLLYVGLYLLRNTRVF